MSNKTKMAAADVVVFDHFPMGRRTGRVVPVGENEFEMVPNAQADDFDLNVDDEPCNAWPPLILNPWS